MTQNRASKHIATHHSEQFHHIPVLIEAVLQYLTPKKGESYLDLTAGYGGHAELILERTLRPDRALLVDRDQTSADYLQRRFGERGVRVVKNDFLSASQQLAEAETKFDMVLADLGVSSVQLDWAERGFAIQKEGPLDMRMDKSKELSAATVVNSYSQAELQEILSRFGEEPRAASIAKTIIANRPISTTSQLATIVAKSWPGHSKQHPATRTFQAIRIAVNDELQQLERSLPLWMSLLAPGGRLAVISFHSLEDRVVKDFFREHSEGYEAELTLLTKKPVLATNNENDLNPRARSAKLRAVVKK